MNSGEAIHSRWYVVHQPNSFVVRFRGCQFVSQPRQQLFTRITGALAAAIRVFGREKYRIQDDDSLVSDCRIRHAVAAVMGVGVSVGHACQISHNLCGVVQKGSVRLDGVIAALIVVIAKSDKNGSAGGTPLELQRDKLYALPNETAKRFVVMDSRGGIELFAKM